VPEDHFGEDVAARYDEGAGSRFDPEAIGRTVDRLAELAGGGRALELGIGTGRVALPLAERGVRVAASSSRPPWPPGSGPSRAAPTSR
jgi:predicted O-methyltransferase YrrM